MSDVPEKNMGSAVKGSAARRELAKGSWLSVVALLEALIEDALARNVSDIHIDPADARLCIRFRVDGLLEEAETLPASLHAELIARIKVLAGLRTDEHRQPQDGRFRCKPRGRSTVDVRVSTLPTYYGENAVLRLLPADKEHLGLEELGFSAAHRALLMRILAHPQGLILATGPTGSGKTMTLYTLAQLLNDPSRSLVTIEDPVEYTLSGVCHIEANRHNGLTFSEGLRSILRQDPDALLVGEIRDQETAGLAVNAALTGHLVLSTLHTNDALAALPRLSDLGIESYLISSTVRLIIAQRLVRRICVDCRQPKRLEAHEQKELSEIVPGGSSLPETWFEGVGCTSCHGRGYQGRIGIFEVLVMSESLREAWNRGVPSAARELAHQAGLEPLVVDGIRKASQGLTTLSEVLRLRHE